jgi:hypothetical protein
MVGEGSTEAEVIGAPGVGWVFVTVGEAELQAKAVNNKLSRRGIRGRRIESWWPQTAEAVQPGVCPIPQAGSAALRPAGDR